MLSRLTIVIVLMLTAVMCFSQAISKDLFSKEEADSLLNSFPKLKTDEARLEVFLKMAEYFVFKEGEEKVDLDKAMEYMGQAAHLNTKIKSEDAYALQILLKSQIARESGQIQQGKELAEIAVKRLTNSKSKLYLGAAYLRLSEYYSWGNLNESAMKRQLVELAVQAYEQTGNLEQLAYCLKHLADLYALNDEREKALIALDSSLKIYEQLKYKRLQAVYVLYTYIYNNDGDYKKALNYGLMALKTAQTDGDSSMSLCQINNYIGITLNHLKENQRAIAYYEDALKIAKRYNDNDALLQVMANAVQSYVDLQEPKKALAFISSIPKKYLEPRLEESHFYAPLSYIIIYIQMKRYAMVQSYCDRVLQLIKSHKPSDKMLHKFYFLLIGFYLESGQYASANENVSRLDSFSRRIGDPHRLKEDFYLKFRLDTAQAHYSSATQNLLKYQSLNDSLFNETTTRQIKQLEVEYETEKNKNEITLLNQKNQLQQNSLDTQKLVKNFTFGGIVLLFIIMGLLYWQYRHKQQSNKVILQKNKQLQHFLTEKEWLVKEIHHRVKNNFHIVASLLEIQSSYLKSKEALSAIKDSQHRIHSMSIIHQKLYQTDTLSTIHMPDYIYELVEYLRESYAIREKIGFSLKIDNVELEHASAITLGLILNESITNAIKYAFARTQEAKKISISLTHISHSQLLLSISDNGRGLPSDFDSKIGSSMGMELLQGLTDDLGGSFSIETNNGTHIKVIFDFKPQVAASTSFA